MNPLLIISVLESLPLALKMLNQLITAVKALGGNTAELEEAVETLEARIPALIDEVRAFQVKRHPDDV